MAEPRQSCIAYCHTTASLGTLDDTARAFQRAFSDTRIVDPDAIVAAQYTAMPEAGNAAPVVCWCMAAVFSKPVRVSFPRESSASFPVGQALASEPVSATAALALLDVWTAFRERVGDQPVESEGSWEAVWAALQAYTPVRDGDGRAPQPGGKPGDPLSEKRGSQ